MSDKLSQNIEDLIRPEIKQLSSYHVPDAAGLLKLDAMENPNPWPGEMLEQWQQALSEASLNRYPDPAGKIVKEGLRHLLDLDSIAAEHDVDLDILLGNGSDEIIQILAMCVAGKGRCIMAPEPGFVMYGMIAKFIGMDYKGVPLKPDFSLDTEAFVSAINEHQPALIFLAVPNNPTGNNFELSSIIEVIEAANGLVVLDEAYMAFTDSDLLELAAKYDNVVVMRTLSKVGLAGLRLGFMIGQSAWLDQFDKVRLPYNINSLTQLSAAFALSHYDVLKAQTDRLRAERDNLLSELEAIDGLTSYPSQANFILVRLASANAKDVFADMKEQGVLVKCLHGAHDLLDNCLRLTVGLPHENAQMLGALKEALKNATAEN